MEQSFLINLCSVPGPALYGLNRMIALHKQHVKHLASCGPIWFLQSLSEKRETHWQRKPTLQKLNISSTSWELTQISTIGISSVNPKTRTATNNTGVILVGPIGLNGFCYCPVKNKVRNGWFFFIGAAKNIEGDQKAQLVACLSVTSDKSTKFCSKSRLGLTGRSWCR